jgi:hypothetical protein
MQDLPFASTSFLVVEDLESFKQRQKKQLPFHYETEVSYLGYLRCGQAIRSSNGGRLQIQMVSKSGEPRRYIDSVPTPVR